MTPASGVTDTTVNMNFNRYTKGPLGSTQKIHWYDPSTYTQKWIANCTGNSGSFVVPVAPPGYYAIRVSEVIYNLWATFKHT